MKIYRLIPVNLVLTLRMVSTPQAANTVAGTTNFQMPGKGIAALFRQKNRHDTILSIGASGEPFGQNNKPCHVSCFVRPTAFARADLARTGSRSNPASSMPHAGSCCGDRVLNSRTARRRSRCHFSHNCRPSSDSRLLVA